MAGWLTLLISIRRVGSNLGIEWWVVVAAFVDVLVFPPVPFVLVDR